MPTHCCWEPSRLLAVPSHAVVKLDAVAAKAVEGAANGQVDPAAADLLDEVQVLEVAAAAGVGDGYAAPLGQPPDELLVNALLQALVVRGVDQELGAVGLELFDGFCGSISFVS